MMTQGGDVISVISMISGLALIIFLAYLTTKMVGRKYGPNYAGTNLLKVVDRLPLGPEKQLVIVRVTDRVLLLGVTAHHIENLGELDPEVISEQPLSTNRVAFSSVLETAFHFKRGGGSPDAEQHGDDKA